MKLIDLINDLKVDARFIDEFIEVISNVYGVKAVYTESCGFDIHPDRRHFELLAYKDQGGYDDDRLAKLSIDFRWRHTLMVCKNPQAVYANTILVIRIAMR